MVFDSELDSDEEDIAADILELSMQGAEPLTHGKSTQSEGSTDLSNKRWAIFFKGNVFSLTMQT
jgi:hypothetical protein